MLQGNKHALGASRQVHRSANATALAGESEGVGVMHNSHTGHSGYVLPASIDQMFILLSLGSQWPVANDAVLRVKDNFSTKVYVVGAQGGHSHAQVHNPAVLELHRQPVAHGLSFQS